MGRQMPDDMADSHARLSLKAVDDALWGRDSPGWAAIQGGN